MTVTSTGESGTGACTLRGAIEAVNTNNSGTPCGAVLSGGFTPINLPANTYTPTGQLQVASGARVEIIGASINDPASTVIDNTGPGRVFEVLSSGQLKLIGLEVTGGQTANGSDGSYPQYGGAAANGGGILNSGSLTLDHVLVTHNFTGHGGRGSDGGFDSQHDAKGGGRGGDGGGIYNSTGASLSMTASTISQNGTGAGGDGGTGSIGVGGVGHFAYGGDGGEGGSPGSGGGIYNAGSATITTSTISKNFTGRGGNGGDGGPGAGPFDGGEGNKSSAGPGGDGGDGGSASYSRRNEFCVCYQPNSILGGGGIANVGGSLTMTASTVSGNNTGAGGNGGGAGVGGLESGHSVTGSHGGWAGSGGVGGGLWTSFGTGTLTNVTFSENFTGDGGVGGNGPVSGSLGPGPGGYGGDGGAIWVNGAHSPYYIQLTHVTISKNSPGEGGLPGAPGAPPEGNPVNPGTPGVRGKGSGIATGGRFDPSGASVYLKNTIVANNGLVSDSNCVYSGASPTDISDLGGSLTWAGTTCPGTSADPKLGPLQDNGGPTFTMLPEAGSAAIGAILSGCSSVPTDQRGYPRPGSGSSCDAGAVETGSAPALTPTTTTVSPSTNPVTAGQPVTFTATVSPPPGAGTVTFTDGGTAISGCSAKNLNGSGQATCQTTYASAGSHSIVVSYTGTSVYEASSSPTLNQVVNAPSTPPVVVTQSPPSGGGGPVVTPPAPTPKPKPLVCRKGFKKKIVNGKPKCVRKHKPRKKHH